ncbi:hypothetical protein [Acidovorax sp. BL-A-41-H1]|uniref:hypothetical protein n=1 Tax=Acidovorax sp. BL-A-41-H1 TaxID=3421102 RepID=UPI003F795A13
MTEPTAYCEPRRPWALYLAGGAPVTSAHLSEYEALRVQRYRDRLLQALQARDKAALRTAKHAVMVAAFGQATEVAYPRPVTPPPPVSPALRRALRDLAWRMSGLLVHERSGGVR